MLNIVAIMGRLVADPELRTTQQGTNVCTFRIACERSYTPKGSMIAIDGSLQTRNYQGKDGSNRTAVEVVANNISFAGAKAADKPVAASYEQQTRNHVQQANATQSAPQPRFTDGRLDAIPDAERYNADSAAFSDTDDLPF